MCPQGQVHGGPSSPLCLAALVLADLPARLYVGLSLHGHCCQHVLSRQREAKRGVLLPSLEQEVSHLPNELTAASLPLTHMEFSGDSAEELQILS